MKPEPVCEATRHLTAPLVLHEPVYFNRHQHGNCRAVEQSPGSANDAHGSPPLAVPHGMVVMCRCCGRRGIMVEDGWEDAYLTGSYAEVILDGHVLKSVGDVETALHSMILDTHMGPTPEDADPGKSWHYGCGGEVLNFKEGRACMECGVSEDYPSM